MLSAARLPQVRAEACILLQASWEQVNSSNCPNHVRRTKCSVKKRIIVRRTVRSMFGEQTFAQLRTGLKALPWTIIVFVSSVKSVSQKVESRWTSAVTRPHCGLISMWERRGVLIALFWLFHDWCHVKLLPFWRTFCVHHTTMHHFTESLYSKLHM